jgi:hypothetical protein
METLSTSETADWRRFREEIKAGQKTFVEVGLKLMQVRDRRLYRIDFATFEDYCEQELGWSPSRSRQLIRATAFWQHQQALSEAGRDVEVPENENQARAMMRAKVLRAVTQNNPLTASPLDKPIAPATVQLPMKPTANLNLRECLLDSWTRLKRLVNRPDVSNGILSELCHVLSTLDRAASLVQLELPGMAERFAVKRFIPPTLEEVQMYCQQEQRQITGADANWFWDHMTSASWKNNGKPVADWKATMRAWWALKTIFPSHKQSNNGPASSPFVQQKELDRVMDRMRVIRSQYADHQAWDEKDRTEFHGLVKRRNELRAKLGVTI